MDTSTKASDTRTYLRRAEKEKRTTLTTYEIPKSFVVTEDNEIIYSQLSTSALQGRANKRHENL